MEAGYGGACGGLGACLGNLQERSSPCTLSFKPLQGRYLHRWPSTKFGERWCRTCRCMGRTCRSGQSLSAVCLLMASRGSSAWQGTSLMAEFSESCGSSALSNFGGRGFLPGILFYCLCCFFIFIWCVFFVLRVLLGFHMCSFRKTLSPNRNPYQSPHLDAPPSEKNKRSLNPETLTSKPRCKAFR